MSSDETVHVFAAGPDYASLRSTVREEPAGEESEASVTFHDVCYEVSVRCGRGRKVILDSCRYAQCCQMHSAESARYMYGTVQ